MRKLLLFTITLIGLFATTNAQQLQWLTQFHGDASWSGDYYPSSVVNDKSGNVLTASSFHCPTDLNPGTGAFFVNPTGLDNAFIQKVSSNNTFIWGKAIGGYGSHVSIIAITTDDTGNVYATGSYSGNIDFDPGPGAYTLYSGSVDNRIYILKLNAAGEFVWVKSIGDYVFANCIQMDKANNIYVGGYFQGLINFNTDTTVDITASVSGSQDGFILKLNSEGNTIWGHKVGGQYAEMVSSIVCDEANLYYTGIYGNTTIFARVADTITLAAGSAYSHVFIAKMDTSGENLWAKQFTATNSAGATWHQKLKMDAAHRLVISGIFAGRVDFDPDPAINDPHTASGDYSSFTERMDSSGNLLWMHQIDGMSWGYDVGTDSMCNVFTTGSFMDRTDFNPGMDSFIMDGSPLRYHDAVYLQKLDSMGNFKSALSIMGTGSVEVYSMSVATMPYVYLTGQLIDTVNFDQSVSGEVYAATPTSSNNGYLVKYAVADVTGINDVNKSAMGIYPNPTTRAITVKCNTAMDKVQVTDITGRIVYNSTPGNMAESLSIEQPGMYFVTVITAGQVLTNKVLVTQ